jgi:hypothetical protein
MTRAVLLIGELSDGSLRVCESNTTCCGRGGRDGEPRDAEVKEETDLRWECRETKERELCGQTQHQEQQWSQRCGDRRDRGCSVRDPQLLLCLRAGSLL